MDNPDRRDLATTVLCLSLHRSVFCCSVPQPQSCSWLTSVLLCQLSSCHGVPSLSALSFAPCALAQIVSVKHATSLANHVLFKVSCGVLALLDKSPIERHSESSRPTHNCSAGSLDGSNGLTSGNWRNSKNVVTPCLSLTTRVKTPSAHSWSCRMVTTVFSPVQSRAHEL